MTQINKIVPEQKTGVQTGASSILHFKSINDAKKKYNEASERLLQVNNWSDFAGDISSEFCLTSATGERLHHSIAQIGNLIRIKLPAPRNEEGKGYDWVCIEEIISEGSASTQEQSIAMTVRPIAAPNTNNTVVAHFYTAEATSTFLVLRKDNSVAAIELGRNEKPNMQGSFCNSVRNFFITIGAWMGFAKKQWQSLMEGILQPKG